MAHSAGILVYRRGAGGLEVLLAHPGGPFWARKDDGAWSIPKGEFDPSAEGVLDAARREFAEETGIEVGGDFIDLGTVRQKAGKTVHAFAVEADIDPAGARSNTFETEWPPHSGLTTAYPEVDCIEWFTPAVAKRKLIGAQAPLIDRLLDEVERT